MPADSKTENLLAKQGIKITQKRRLVLEILKQTDTSVTAEDIYLKLKENNTEIWLSTVYRVLELLTEKGLVTKLNITNEGKTSYVLNAGEHRHYITCLSCGKTLPIPECPMKSLEEEIQLKTDYDIKEHRLELYGYCPQCKTDKTANCD